MKSYRQFPWPRSRRHTSSRRRCCHCLHLRTPYGRCWSMRRTHPRRRPRFLAAELLQQEQSTWPKLQQSCLPFFFLLLQLLLFFCFVFSKESWWVERAQTSRLFIRSEIAKFYVWWALKCGMSGALYDFGQHLFVLYSIISEMIKWFC